MCVRWLWAPDVALRLEPLGASRCVGITALDRFVPPQATSEPCTVLVFALNADASPAAVTAARNAVARLKVRLCVELASTMMILP